MVAQRPDDYDLTSQVDACVLGGRMYPGGAVPTPAEVEWARFASRTPHYVVSNTLTSAAWPHTRFLRSLDELSALKLEQGKDVYLMGDGAITAAAIDAGLVDELRLIVYPLIAGEGRALFASSATRHGLELRKAEQLPDGRLSLVYGISG